MTIVSNEVFDTPFSSVELTNDILRRKHRANSLEGEFEWETTLSPTTAVRINLGNEGDVDVAPYVPRGGVPPTFGDDERSAVTIEIPGIAGRAHAYNREALNVTAGLTGEQRLMSLELLRSQKNQKIATAIDEGEARQVVEALRGIGTDHRTGRKVFDLYQLQGKTQLEFDLDLNDSKLGLNGGIEEIKEEGELLIGKSASILGWKFIMGLKPSKSIRNCDEYKDMLTSPLAQYQAKVDGRKTVPINDNVELVHYRHGFLAEDEAYLVPIYAGHAQRVYGPHEADEFWGNVLPRYVTTEPMPHGKGLEMEGWAYVLRYFRHPEAIFKIKVIG